MESPQPFATAREYLAAELAHYRLQLKRLFKESGRSVEEWPQDTYVGDEEIERAFHPAAPGSWDEVMKSRLQIDARMVSTLQTQLFIPIASTVQSFSLTELDWEILLALLAPAVSIELERLARAAWRDFTVHHPSAGFLARLLRPDDEGGEEVLQRLAHDAPLRRHRLIRETSKIPAGPAHELFQIDPHVASYLHLGNVGLARELAEVARLTSQAAVPLADVVSPSPTLKRAMISRAAEGPSRILLAGPTGAGKRTLARALGAELGAHTIEVDLHRLLADPAQLAELLPLALRDAQMFGAHLYFDGRLEWDGSTTASGVERFCAQIADHPLPVFFGSRISSPRLRETVVGAMEVIVKALVPDEQPAHFARQIERHGFVAPGIEDLRGSACQAGLTPGVIERAVSEAVAHARLHDPDNTTLHLDDLRDALRTRVANGIAGIATRVPTVHTWDDVVLPVETGEQLEEILDYARNQELVLHKWGFDAKLPYGRSLSALFTGPPGTGKTMMAGVIARSLGRDLYRVDLANIVSKYIGETEKNLARVFDEAEGAQAIILFDEADSLFGKRTEVRNSVDRYANLEVNYLLQRIEDYPGVAILTTNFPKSIDEAFRRRLRFIIDFPAPDFETRKRLWSAMIPPTAEVAPNLPFDELAQRFDISPGLIKNAVLKAAFNAAAYSRPIDGPALLRAAYYVAVGAGKLVGGFEPPAADGSWPSREETDDLAPDGLSGAEQIEATQAIVRENEIRAAVESGPSEGSSKGRRVLSNFPFPPRGKLPER